MVDDLHSILAYYSCIGIRSPLQFVDKDPKLILKRYQQFLHTSREQQNSEDEGIKGYCSQNVRGDISLEMIFRHRQILLKQMNTEGCSASNLLHTCYPNDRPLKTKHTGREFSTGCDGINNMLGGGVFCGEILEVFGPSGCGKTEVS